MTEQQNSVSTVMIVIGGVDSMLLLLVIGIFFLRAAPRAGSAVMPGVSTSTVVGGQLMETVTERRELEDGEWVEGTTTSKDGVRVVLVLRRSTANGIVETRAAWCEDGALDPEASGKYEAGQRVRALTPEEIEEIEGF